jgi:hypothetical protein
MAVNWFQKFKSIGFVVDDQLEKILSIMKIYVCTLAP